MCLLPWLSFRGVRGVLTALSKTLIYPHTRACMPFTLPSRLHLCLFCLSSKKYYDDCANVLTALIIRAVFPKFNQPTAALSGLGAAALQAAASGAVPRKTITRSISYANTSGAGAGAGVASTPGPSSGERGLLTGASPFASLPTHLVYSEAHLSLSPVLTQ
jgi:hypothetical protein